MNEKDYYKSFTEAQWQLRVQSIARINGWKYYHAPDNMPNKYGRIQNIIPGFPDLVLVKNGRIIFAELKKETGRLSESQKEWIDELKQCNLEVYVWRPSDENLINKVLKSEK